MSLERLLADRLAVAYAAVAGEPVDPAVRRSQRADFQSDASLPLARRLGRPPREIAADVVRLAELGDLCETVEVSGPGFINLVVADRALGSLSSAMAQGARLGVERPTVPVTVVVDYSAPNVAKEMHVGHLRSTVIGDAAVRLLEWLGHRVIRANHLGDWGTPFGMLIEHLLDIGESEAANELSVGDLDSFYRAARVKFDADEEFKQRARSRVVALQGGDERTRRLWRLLVAESERYFLTVYDRLGVTLTEKDFCGESFYNDMLAPVVEELDQRGLLRDSDGAACVFPQGFTGRDGQPVPIIVRKSDGGFGYGATDLAAIRHRTRDLDATRMLYVVGLPQRQHFEMVYAVAREAGWLRPPATAEHVGFGSVLGRDGRMLRSRAGASIKLIGLLDEAVARAAELARQKNPDLDETSVAGVALEGNTAPYLQYAHARIRSIFRRAGIDSPVGTTITVTEPAEHALAIELLAFGAVVATVAETLEFHRLAGYLYTLATTFSAFYENCSVLRAEDDIRDSRLALCGLTARVLRQGLCMLGITTPDRM